jgi:hypothetical protein
MNVHSILYKDASAPCHRLEARAIVKNADTFESKPVHACREIRGSDCYVYSDSVAKGSDFGELVQDCFDTRRSEIE